jgi:hypothetical protein
VRTLCHSWCSWLGCVPCSCTFGWLEHAQAECWPTFLSLASQPAVAVCALPSTRCDANTAAWQGLLCWCFAPLVAGPWLQACANIALWHWLVLEFVKHAHPLPSLVPCTLHVQLAATAIAPKCWGSGAVCGWLVRSPTLRWLPCLAASANQHCS